MKIAEKKIVAQGLFTRSTMTRKEIASTVDVTEKTLRGWIVDGNWEQMRDAMQITKPKLLNDAYRQLAAINKKIDDELGGVPNKELSDAKATIRKEIEKFETSPIHIFVEVFEELIDFLSKNDPEKLQEFTMITQRFLMHKNRS
jgi:transposase